MDGERKEGGRRGQGELYDVFQSEFRFIPFYPVFLIIIWLALRAGKMTQIGRCDWLPERARWSHLARSGLPVVSRKKNIPESHIHCNKSFIDQVCSVKMAGYWPRSFLASL